MHVKVMLLIRALIIFKNKIVSEISLPLSLSHPATKIKASFKTPGNSRICDFVFSKLIWILLSVSFGKRLMYWENLLSTLRRGESQSSCFKHEVMNVKDRKTMKTKFSKYGLDLIFLILVYMRKISQMSSCCVFCYFSCSWKNQVWRDRIWDGGYFNTSILLLNRIEEGFQEREGPKGRWESTPWIFSLCW